MGGDLSLKKFTFSLLCRGPIPPPPPRKCSSHFSLTTKTVTADTGNLRLAVMLPEGEDINEWVAVNTVDFFNQVSPTFFIINISLILSTLLRKQ